VEAEESVASFNAWKTGLPGTLVCVRKVQPSTRCPSGEVRAVKPLSMPALNAPALTHSVRNACITSTRAARAAGTTDATTAATSKRTAAPITSSALGIRTSCT
jgi:hypothetical protein